MAKLLYYMHVPWTWVKQRPHFLAEYLQSEFTLTVAYDNEPLGKNQKAANPVPAHARLLPIPRFPGLDEINDAIATGIFKNEIIKHDLLWLTDPRLYLKIRSVIPDRTTIVFDCMDDTIAFDVIKHSPSLLEAISEAERALLARAALVLFSSETLQQRIFQRYRIEDLNHRIVNNAFDESFIHPSPLPFEIQGILEKIKHQKIILYVGTISDYLDHALLLEHLNRDPRIVYCFAGPLQCSLPMHERIVFLGVVPHAHLFTLCQRADALVMPFKIDPLIEAVDPVKAYEYIVTGVPTVLPRYSETEKFKNYAHLYSTTEEYFQQLENRIHSPGTVDLALFRSNNNWRSRVGTLRPLINALPIAHSAPETRNTPSTGVFWRLAIPLLAALSRYPRIAWISGQGIGLLHRTWSLKQIVRRERQ